MLHEFKIKVLSPLTISVKEGFKGFIYKTLREYIPGSVIKGGLLSKIVREYGTSEAIKVVNEEGSDPQISITQALACPNMNYTLFKNVLPTHPLCYRWKSEKQIKTFNIRDFIEGFKKGKDLRNAYSKIMSKIMEFHYKYFETRNILRSSSEITSKPAIAIKKNGGWEEVSVKTSMYLQVGIDKVSKKASPGLIYGYEYVEPGQYYTGFIAGRRIKEIISALGDATLELRIGRGISRGFGTIIFKLCEMNVKDFFKEVLSRVVEVEDLKPGEPLILYSLTPLVTEPLGSALKAEIKNYLELPTYWISKNVGKLNAKLKLKIYGALSFGSEIYRGFSLRTATPKIAIKGLTKGTLLLCEITEVSGSLDELEKLLVYTVFYGLDHLTTQGFNHVVPITKDPFLT